VQKLSCRKLSRRVKRAAASKSEIRVSAPCGVLLYTRTIKPESPDPVPPILLFHDRIRDHENYDYNSSGTIDGPYSEKHKLVAGNHSEYKYGGPTTEQE
jgi:hypothetical protein